MLAAFPLGDLGNTAFNEATMVFIPKKTDRVLDGTHCCEPGEVRPLSVVNTDNRLLAAATPAPGGTIGGHSHLPLPAGFPPRAASAPQCG